MNARSIAVLARADLRLNRTAAMVYAGAAATGAALASAPDQSWRSLGVSLVLCVLIGQCFHLPIVAVFQDSARGTRTFALSLPVTPAEYAAGKIVACSLLFLLPACAAAIATAVAPGSQLLFPLPMVLLGLLGALIFFVQSLGVALVSESMGVSMTVLLAQIFLLGNGIPRLGPRVKGWFRFWEELHTGGPLRDAAGAIFLVELLVTLTLVLFFMSRKRRFV